MGSGFDGGQPDTEHLDENLENGVATMEPIGPHPQFPGVQARLTVIPLEERVEVAGGLQSLGWTGVETPSAAFLAANPIIAALFWWDAALRRWLVDSSILPDGVRPAAMLRRGDAAFLSMAQPGTIIVPLTHADLE